MNASVLSSAGPVAHSIATVTWVMFVGGGLILAFVMWLLARSLRSNGSAVSTSRWILGGGIAFPLVVLIALGVWTLPMGKVATGGAPAGALMVSITGHLWWWEARYTVDGVDVITANEMHIPTGRPVYVALTSSDVIHSFWVPALAGKIDMVPGRINHLLIEADREGEFRGPCAEYCGAQHSKMSMHVIARSPADFDAWIRGQARPAANAALSARQRVGMQAFLANRCDACHTVRGVTGDSRLAPDLTHIASRRYLAAGTLPNRAGSLANWIAHVQEIKPGARMPSYDHIDQNTLQAMADWMGTLE